MEDGAWAQVKVSTEKSDFSLRQVGSEFLAGYEDETR